MAFLNPFDIRTQCCITEFGDLGHRCMAEIIAFRFIELELLPFVKTNVLSVIWQLLLPVHFTLLLQKKISYGLPEFYRVHLFFLLDFNFGLWPNLNQRVMPRFYRIHLF